MNREIDKFAAKRGISEVLHFTTDKGLIGIFGTGAVLSRDRLTAESYVEHIYTPNCRDRLKDAGWTDYVNLSISEINGRMLGVSENWHSCEDLWWAVLAFEPSILGDPGIHFTTTNNTYPCVQRAEGVAGLTALFDEPIEWGYRGSVRRRTPGMPQSRPTDPQAEVLYPGSLTLDRLTAVYVRDPEHADDVHGLIGVLPRAVRVPVIHRREIFI